MSNAQVTIALTKIDKQVLGYQAITLTNFSDNLNLPAIAAGSKVEIAGSLFDITADEAISGWGGIANSTAVYIMLTVSGSSFTATFVTAAPTWDTAKQGWYSGLNRYIGGLYKDGGGNYTKKYLFRASSGGVQNFREYGDGTIEVLGALTVDGVLTAVGGLSALSVSNAAIQAAAVSSAKVAWTLSASSHTCTANEAYVLPSGLYLLTAPYASGVIQLEYYMNGGWLLAGDLGSSGGNPARFTFADGANVRVHNLTGSFPTLYMLKMA